MSTRFNRTPLPFPSVTGGTGGGLTMRLRPQVAWSGTGFVAGGGDPRLPATGFPVAGYPAAGSLAFAYPAAGVPAAGPLDLAVDGSRLSACFAAPSCATPIQFDVPGTTPVVHPRGAPV